MKRVHPIIMGNICAKTDQNTLISLITIVFIRLFVLWPWPLISDLQNYRVHPLLLWKNVLSLIKIHLTSLIFIVCVHKVIFIFVYYNLDLWPLTSKINRVHALIMGNICAKFNQNTLHGLISTEFTRLFPFFVYCDLDLWPLTSKINRVHPLLMFNMSAMFRKNAHSDLVFITFTRASVTHWRMDALMDGTTAVLLCPLCNTLLEDNKKQIMRTVERCLAWRLPVMILSVEWRAVNQCRSTILAAMFSSRKKILAHLNSEMYKHYFYYVHYYVHTCNSP